MIRHITTTTLISWIWFGTSKHFNRLDGNIHSDSYVTGVDWVDWEVLIHRAHVASRMSTKLWHSIKLSLFFFQFNSFSNSLLQIQNGILVYDLSQILHSRLTSSRTFFDKSLDRFSDITMSESLCDVEIYDGITHLRLSISIRVLSMIPQLPLHYTIYCYSSVSVIVMESYGNMPRALIPAKSLRIGNKIRPVSLPSSAHSTRWRGTRRWGVFVIDFQPSQFHPKISSKLIYLSICGPHPLPAYNGWETFVVASVQVHLPLQLVESIIFSLRRWTS